ncbi:type II toxin-antitoxin system HipA family toxin [Pararobbsia silviterrae]|uniref:Type II toxin-antitoxin system HipA family toxin n=1 Tax=Pararobbsia silviterrae TaxID=1792498 RepID=A0A494X7E5_9BURK|nr:type II toxin-antitoxin system HipA family toxin [Pararobbsia silviterrae]RKP46627.1 type II toxin-antitoxin system HipA family toxin [Pararobbsia silviterrae]
MAVLDIYCNATRVGTLAEEAHNGVFTYLPGTSSADVVSLLMPVRNGSYIWPGGIMPSFQMNLPEGFKKDLIRRTLGPHADVSDFGLLALTGANTIGRVRAVPLGASFGSATSRFDMARLLASPDSRAHLLRHLEAGITEGVSGVMPKSLASGDQKATVWTDAYILKTGPVDLPGLSINEYLCLEVARHAGLDVPETHLSDDGQVLAVRRFDLNSDGTRLGVEDFCALKGLDPVRKYQGTVEDLAKLCNQYLGVEHRKDSKRKLFALLLLNHALRNADAHLKNYALTYTNEQDARLSPVYDIVTVTAYPRFQDDLPALPLKGKKTWRSGKALFEYGGVRLSLSATDMHAVLEHVVRAVQRVLPCVSEYADRYPEFREVGKRMLDAWAQGLEDIRPDAKPGKGEPAPLREQAGLSDTHSSHGRKARNPYVDPNGPFGHKSR